MKEEFKVGGNFSLKRSKEIQVVKKNLFKEMRNKYYSNQTT